MRAEHILPTALALERAARFGDAETLLLSGYNKHGFPLFLMEAACLMANRRGYSDALTAAKHLSSGHPAFEHGHRLLAVLEFIDSGRRFASVPTEWGELRFWVTGQNWELESEWIGGSVYQRAEVEYLVENAIGGTRVIDIGANAGNHAACLAKARPDVTVVVVEPEPRAVEMVRTNVDLNRLPNVDCGFLGMACAPEPGRLRLQFRGSVSSTRKSCDQLGIDVGCVTLPELLAGGASIVKMDIEGMEVSVLAAASDAVREAGCLVMMEMLEKNRADVSDVLTTHGLRVVKRIAMHAGETVVLAAGGV